MVEAKIITDVALNVCRGNIQGNYITSGGKEGKEIKRQVRSL